MVSFGTVVLQKKILKYWYILTYQKPQVPSWMEGKITRQNFKRTQAQFDPIWTSSDEEKNYNTCIKSLQTIDVKRWPGELEAKQWA